MRILLTISILFIALGSSMAQNPRIFRGQLVQASDTSLPVAYAHVVNLRTEVVTVSDVEGRFQVYARLQDTLEIRMIGFQDTLITALQIKKAGQKIPVRERVYQLRQVNVSADRLSQPFAPTERSDDPFAGYKSVRPANRPRTEDKISFGGASANSPGLIGGTSLQGGVTYLANLLSKKHKQREKINKLKAQAAQRKYYEALFDYWFPPELISKITELEGAEANRFRESLKPTRRFLEEANEYEVIIYLMKRWNAYAAGDDPKQGAWFGY